MKTRFFAVLGAVTGLLACWVAWGAYVITTTERVPYDVVDAGDGYELRRYPETVLVETTAESENAAFWRLYRYITGENKPSDEVAMTAPVASDGESIPMTAPVRTGRDGSDEVAMTAPVRAGKASLAFYLPAEYTPETAPIPTDPAVRLVVEPPRTVATRRFSWYATDRRVERNERALLRILAERGIERRGGPVVLQYNDPWTPPFMRRNEIAVPVEY